jgi:hypothetical protein
MNINIIIILIYLTIITNLGIQLLFIPFFIIKTYFPKYQYVIFSFKHILWSSISFLLKSFMKVKINVNSKKLLNEMITENTNSKNIVIMNHITELDPLLITPIINNFSFYTKSIFVCKKLIGYLLSSFGMIGIFSNEIFLDRNLISDQNKLSQKLDTNFIFLYPEGTCFTKDRKNSSDKYCEKNNLVKFKYHIYPRITGIDLILKNNKDINCVCDLTIIYDSIEKKSYGNHYTIFKFINKYKLPSKIFININKYKINKNQNIKNQIENIYIRKDKFIKNFDIYNNNFYNVNYNYFNGISRFIIFNLFSLLSLYILFKFNFIKFLYLIQMVVFLFYFFIYG